MSRFAIIPILCCLACLPLSAGGAQFETDTFLTSAGDLANTFIGHGTLLFQWGGKVIHVDPVGQYADYAQLLKADLVLITHEHSDHLDPTALAAIRTEKTVLVLTQACATKVQGGIVMGNGYGLTLGGKRVYVAGDSENTPEMKALKGIDIAFLPMNLPFTMLRTLFQSGPSLAA